MRYIALVFASLCLFSAAVGADERKASSPLSPESVIDSAFAKDSKEKTKPRQAPTKSIKKPSKTKNAKPKATRSNS